ncbi:transposase [Lyngbya sp. CCAP 1446/10]|uniref:zinc ribbon domain-containing protein n=1 Tax=Lyngbya sp. CCAP 1446/10 TaxID=439293 RepID=UPI002237C174|nr:zinc ribbon domain-containing protein [Lyngbya sp. CCAP 1446/10]MCW6050109.1 transposase [Lyngbya sp. CCAP 1446/10]
MQCFETLNFKGTQRLWGRKISDLTLGEFWQILEWVGNKKDLPIVFCDRWYPSSKTCLNCGHILKELDWSTRKWRCPSGQSLNGRDENAALTICAIGVLALNQFFLVKKRKSPFRQFLIVPVASGP